MKFRLSLLLDVPANGAAGEVVPRLDLDDADIVADIDTREDYRALTGRMA